MRARTRPGRLGALDAWVVHEQSPLLVPGARVVDVGYGESPVTVVELAAALRAVQPGLTVHGVEREASRVPPPPWAEGVTLGWGEAPGPAVLVRAMNVLRSYRADEVAPLHAALGAALDEGGLLLEGSSDTEGHVLTCHLLRKRGGALVSEGLLCFTDLSRGFSPWLFRDWLPRDLRRSVKPGTPVHALFTRWDACLAASGAREPRERFLASARVPGLASSAWERAHGFLRWDGR